MVTSGIRQVDPARDMPAIVELIELGFGPELDPPGQRMLSEMQTAARHGNWTRFFSDNSLEPQGFVWLADGAVVANLSLRVAYPRSRKGRLIGNVIVHPDYQGQGIGRTLMEAALDTVRKHSVHWVGLEVRVDNAAACQLYSSQGFDFVGRIHHLVRPQKCPWPPAPSPQLTWRTSRPKHQAAWDRLANAVYGTHQAWVMESRPGLYDYGGWGRQLDLWFHGQREWAWFQEETGESAMAARIKTDRRYHYHQWDFLIRPPVTVTAAQEILIQASQTLGRVSRGWPVVAMIPNQPVLMRVLHDAGFITHRTLGQMLLKL